MCYIFSNNQHQGIHWDKLFALIPVIESTIKFGEWPDKMDGKGTMESPYIMPHQSWSRVVDEFHSLVYETGLVIQDFEWMNWQEGKDLMDKLETEIDTLDAETICKLITMMVRAERFSEGYLVSCFKEGKVLLLLKQLKQFVKK